MDQKLEGKTALVTGGSAGIGRGIAQCFLEVGANVMITSRKAEKCEEAADELRALRPLEWTRPAGMTGVERTYR